MAAVMNSLTDKWLVDIISKGGGAVGKSSFMPAWGGALDEKQIRDIVGYIRTIAVPPYKPLRRRVSKFVKFCLRPLDD